jgi:hypothetical protein
MNSNENALSPIPALPIYNYVVMVQSSKVQGSWMRHIESRICVEPEPLNVSYEGETDEIGAI